VKGRSDVIFDEDSNAHIVIQHGSNVINWFGLPEDEGYVEEIETGDDLP